MHRLARPIILVPLLLGICLVAFSVWVYRNSHRVNPPPVDDKPPSKELKCAEWDKAQASGEGVNWDLTYESLLKENGFGPDSTIWKWIHTDGRRPPLKEIVAAWQDEPIISSMLIEIAGPEGSPGGFWLIRTTNHIYYLGFDKGEFDRRKKELNVVQDYDKAFESMACWQQATPHKDDTFLQGYYGFLSLYKEGKSRQMLLTFRDFYLFDSRDGEKRSEDPNNWGRLWKILEPLLPTTMH